MNEGQAQSQVSQQDKGPGFCCTLSMMVGGVSSAGWTYVIARLAVGGQNETSIFNFLKIRDSSAMFDFN